MRDVQAVVRETNVISNEEILDKEPAQDSLEQTTEKKSFGRKVLGFFGLGKDKSNDSDGVEDQKVLNVADLDLPSEAPQTPLNNDSLNTPVSEDFHVPAALVDVDDGSPINLVAHQNVGNVGVFTSTEDAAILKRIPKKSADSSAQFGGDKAPVVLFDDVITSSPTVKADSALGQAVRMGAKQKDDGEDAVANTDVLDKVEENAVVLNDVDQDTASSVAARVEDSAPEIKTDPLLVVFENDENKIRVWQAKGGKSLKRVLTRWSVVENVELDWNAEEKYDLDKDIFIKGTFESAIETLFKRGLVNAPQYSLSDDPNYVLSVRD